LAAGTRRDDESYLKVWREGLSDEALAKLEATQQANPGGVPFLSSRAIETGGVSKGPSD